MSEVLVSWSDDKPHYVYQGVPYFSQIPERITVQPENYLRPENVYIPVSTLISKLTSQPILLSVRDNYNQKERRAFATSGPDGSFNIIAPTAMGSSKSNRIFFADRISIPNPQQSEPSPLRLKPINLNHLPPFDPDLLRRLQNSAHSNRITLADFNSSFIQLKPNPFAGTGMSQITFQQLPQIISRVTSFTVDPEL